jgi:twitching motility protein PilT
VKRAGTRLTGWFSQDAEKSRLHGGAGGANRCPHPNVTAMDLIAYLRATRDQAGSDLHLTVGAPPAVRVAGKLEALEDFDLTPEQCRELILGALTETQRARLEQDWELDFAMQVRELGRFRGNAHFVRGNLEAAFRYVPDHIPDLAELGHSPTLEVFCRKPQGLILVTGITGSGKSTTLAAMIKRISEQRSCVVITIEDPIEFLFPHAYGIVKQRQIGQDTRGFAEALRAALRQDPDVIMVSEMRDLETIRTAVTAAETGHLVLATLHTQDAPKALDRLVDVFPGEQQPQILAQLANCLVGVVAQKLLPRADGAARVLASEILVANHGIRTCIRERKWEQIPGLMEVGTQDGMHTFDASLAHLAAAGLIALPEALNHARDPEFVNRHVHAAEAAKAKKNR